MQLSDIFKKLQTIAQYIPLFLEIEKQSEPKGKSAFFSKDLNFKLQEKIFSILVNHLKRNAEMYQWSEAQRDLLYLLLKELQENQSFLFVDNCEKKNQKFYPLFLKLDRVLGKEFKIKGERSRFRFDISTLWSFFLKSLKNSSSVLSQNEKKIYSDEKNVSQLYMDLLESIFNQVSKKKPKLWFKIVNLQGVPLSSTEKRILEQNSIFSFFFHKNKYGERNLNLLSASWLERFSCASELLSLNLKGRWTEFQPIKMSKYTEKLLFSDQSFPLLRNVANCFRERTISLPTFLDDYVLYKKHTVIELFDREYRLPLLKADILDTYVVPFLNEQIEENSRQFNLGPSGEPIKKKWFWNIGKLPTSKKPALLFSLEELKENGIEIGSRHSKATDFGEKNVEEIYQYMREYLDPTSYAYMVESGCDGVIAVDIDFLIKFVETLAQFS